MAAIGLVACGKGKLDTAAPARQLYTGQLFRKASAFAEATYDQWFILSAKHGLLSPDEVIEPYDLSMAHLASDQRQAWAVDVAKDLTRLGLEDSEFFFHAGSRYTNALAPMLGRSAWPLQGLGIGRQLAGIARRVSSIRFESALGSCEAAPFSGRSARPSEARGDCPRACRRGIIFPADGRVA